MDILYHYHYLKNVNKFIKIELKSVYWQIEMDDKAKEISVINTHKVFSLLIDYKTPQKYFKELWNNY